MPTLLCCSDILHLITPGTASAQLPSDISRRDCWVVVQWLSSQIGNVCALLETSTKFGTLVDMVAAITSSYRTTSTAPPGGWRRHILNVGTWCHISVHNFGSRRDFFILFSDLYSGDVYSLSVYYLSTFQ